MAINKTEAKLLRILINRGEVYADKNCPKESRAVQTLVAALGYAIECKDSFGGFHRVLTMVQE